jgi:hypothetical protein
MTCQICKTIIASDDYAVEFFQGAYTGHPVLSTAMGFGYCYHCWLKLTGLEPNLIHPHYNPQYHSCKGCGEYFRKGDQLIGLEAGTRPAGDGFLAGRRPVAFFHQACLHQPSMTTQPAMPRESAGQTQPTLQGYPERLRAVLAEAGYPQDVVNSAVEIWIADAPKPVVKPANPLTAAIPASQTRRKLNGHEQPGRQDVRHPTVTLQVDNVNYLDGTFGFVVWSLLDGKVWYALDTELKPIQPLPNDWFLVAQVGVIDIGKQARKLAARLSSPKR